MTTSLSVHPLWFCFMINTDETCWMVLTYISYNQPTCIYKVEYISYEDVSPPFVLKSFLLHTMGEKNLYNIVCKRQVLQKKLQRGEMSLYTEHLFYLISIYSGITLANIISQ